MGKAADSFGRQLTEIDRNLVARASETMRAIGQQAFKDITTHALTVSGFGAPVASGRYVASMNISLNQPDFTPAPADPSYRYPPGSGPRELPPRTIPTLQASAVALTLRRFKLGDTIFISNGVPYVRKIEINGHSWQTPDGVFGPTIRSLSVKFANVTLRRV